jgi:hypothetical protein
MSCPAKASIGIWSCRASSCWSATKATRSSEIHDLVDDFRGIADAEGEGQTRIAFAHPRQRRHDMGGAVGGDPQMAALQCAAAGEKRFRFVFCREQPCGDHEQALPKRGQLHLPAGAIEQPDAIGVLKPTHLGGERRLADMARLCGAGEALRLGDGVEGREPGIADRHRSIGPIYRRYGNDVLDLCQRPS